MDARGLEGLVMELVLLIVLALTSVVAAVFLHGLAVLVKRALLEIHLLRTAVGDLGGPLYDTRRKQEEVLDTVGKHGAEMLALLASIRDLNTKDLTDRKEILQSTNIKATSRVTSTRDWMANLEAAANKEWLGLGGDKS